MKKRSDRGWCQILDDLDRNRHYSKIAISQVPCLRCGTCCSKYQPHLNWDEAHLIAEKLGASWSQFLKEYTDPRWPGTRTFLIRHKQDACIFLQTSEDKKQLTCRIHAFKPACCREWQENLNRAECQEGLKSRWDLTIDASGQITGFQNNMEQFERYVAALKG